MRELEIILYYLLGCATLEEAKKTIHATLESNAPLTGAEHED